MRWLQTLLAATVAALCAALLLAALDGDGSADDEGAGDGAESGALLAAVVPPADEPPPGPEDLAAAIDGQLQAAPGAIAVVPDPAGGEERVFSLTVEEGDVYPVTPTDDPRAQILTRPAIEPGDEIWLSTKFLLPSDFPALPGWMSLISIYGPPFEGSSPWQIGIDRDAIRWQRNADHGYDVPWQMPLARDRWIDVLLHQRFAADGWVEMWVDGERVVFFGSGTFNPTGQPPTTRLAMATMDDSNDGGSNSAKIMQYRQAGMVDSATVYFGALRVGTTRASVQG
jgi:hypothetical protein